MNTQSQKMIAFIEPFLASKSLANNSQQAYRYDLRQFCQQVGQRINPETLALYQQSLSSLTAAAKKRKLSTVNQFLYYLYQQKALTDYFKMDDRIEASFSLKPQLTRLDTSAFYAETAFLKGQLIALLILELGLTPSEIAGLRLADFDLGLQVLRLQSHRGIRVMTLSKALLPFLERAAEAQQLYLFDHDAKPFSRQWFFNQLRDFLESIGCAELSAQSLREQFILNEKAAGKSIIEVAQLLGLKSPITLEKYYKM